MEFPDLPALTGPAISQTLGFFFTQASALLDRRRKTGEAADRVEVPECLTGELSRLEADESVLDANRSKLESLTGTLAVYNDHPEIVRPDDERLLSALAQVRILLEEIYGQHLTFEGENRPRSGVAVRQKMGRVAGKLVGVDADAVTDSARVNVSQTADHAEQGSTVIGARVKKIG